MKLHRDIFKITKDNKLFLRYLYRHSGFSINELAKEFDMSYDALLKYLRIWEEQGYITKEKLAPKLGGTKYIYSLSEKAVKELKDMFSLQL